MLGIAGIAGAPAAGNGRSVASAFGNAPALWVGDAAADRGRLGRNNGGDEHGGKRGRRDTNLYIEATSI